MLVSGLTFIAGVALTPVSLPPSVGQTHAVAAVVLLTGRGLLVAEGEGEGRHTSLVTMGPAPLINMVSGADGFRLVNICCLIIICQESVMVTVSQ